MLLAGLSFGAIIRHYFLQFCLLKLLNINRMSDIELPWKFRQDKSGNPPERTVRYGRVI